jgi:sterol desaturase/sphingolipid hydroxylase (fatty acid hydroxylase superfamily)
MGTAAIFFITAALVLSLNVLAVLCSIAICKWGIPAAMRLQNRPHPMAVLRERLPLYLFNVTVLLLLTAGGLWWAADKFVVAQPSAWAIFAQLAVITLIDDAWFYGWHRLLHENKWMYNKIHRIHHRAFSPLPFEYIYVHPVEWMVGSVGSLLGLLAVHVIWGGVPLWTFWAFALIRTVHELDIHSGTRSIIGPWIPFFGLTEHHDLHHAKPTKGNYASIFTLWDRALGTHWRPSPSAESVDATPNGR